MANIAGTSYSEVLYGTDESDLISGAGGDDSIFGGGGNDTAVFGANRVHFEIIALSGVVRVTGLFTAPWQYAFEEVRLTEVETLQFSDRTVAIAPTVGQLTLGTSYNESLVGGSGTDVLDGAGGDDTIVGGSGNDTALFFGPREDFDIIALSGVVRLTGQADAPWRYAFDEVRLTEVETLQFSDHTVAIAPTVGQLTLGTSYNESLVGGSGTDVLDGAGGDDTIAGGAGNDTALFFGPREDFDIIALSGVVRVTGQFDAPWRYAFDEVRLTEVETLQFSDHTVAIAPTVGQLTLGTSYSESLVGGSGPDVLDGAGGDDTIVGGAGNDTALFFGPREDFDIIALSGVVRVTGQFDAPWRYAFDEVRLTEVETLQFSAKAVSIRAAPGQLQLGTSYSESLTGSTGADVFDGAGGNDTIAGGAGHDIALFFGSRADFDVEVMGPGVFRVSGKSSAPWRYSYDQVWLDGIEELQFADASVLADTAEPAPMDSISGTGLLAAMAQFSKAAYSLRPDEPRTSLVFLNDYLNDLSPGADEALQALRNEGWRLLGPEDLGSALTLVQTGRDGEFHTGLSGGIYTNENGAALIARSADSLVVAFRGTNDARYAPAWFSKLLWGWTGIQSADQSHWVGAEDHLVLFDDLIGSIEAYVAASPEISNVYVTGHSLGATMAQGLADVFDLPSNVSVKATLFASPGGLGGFSDDPAITNFWVDGDSIEWTAAAHANAGDKNIVQPSITWRYGSESLTSPFTADELLAHGVDSIGGGGGELHSMGLYLHIAQRLNQSTGGAIDRFLSGVGAQDYDRLALGIDAQLRVEQGDAGRTDDEWHWYEFTEPSSSILDAQVLHLSEPTVLVGTAGADLVEASDFGDLIVGAAGDDIIDGHAGIDTALYTVARAQATIDVSNGAAFVSAEGEGSDLLTHVERLQFADQCVAIDLSGSAGMVAKVIGAVFGPEYVDDGGLVGIGLGVVDAGITLHTLIELALSTALFGGLAGGPDGVVSDQEFVSFVYDNVIGSLPGPGDLSYLTELITSGEHTRQSLTALACDLPQNLVRIDFAGLVANGLTFSTDSL